MTEKFENNLKNKKNLKIIKRSESSVSLMKPIFSKISLLSKNKEKIKKMFLVKNDIYKRSNSNLCMQKNNIDVPKRFITFHKCLKSSHSKSKKSSILSKSNKSVTSKNLTNFNKSLNSFNLSKSKNSLNFSKSITSSKFLKTIISSNSLKSVRSSNFSKSLKSSNFAKQNFNSNFSRKSNFSKSKNFPNSQKIFLISKSSLINSDSLLSKSSGRKINHPKKKFSNFRTSIKNFVNLSFKTISNHFMSDDYFFNDPTNFKKKDFSCLKKKIFSKENNTLKSFCKKEKFIKKIKEFQIANFENLKNKNSLNTDFKKGEDLLNFKNIFQIYKLKIFFHQKKLTAFQFYYRTKKTKIKGILHGKIFLNNPFIINLKDNDNIRTIVFYKENNFFTFCKIITFSGIVIKTGQDFDLENYDIEYIDFNICYNIVSVESFFNKGVISSILFNYIN